MPGILDLDVVCLSKIFKFLKPLDFCSLRQSCTQVRHFVDDHFRSVYFAQEECLDLSAEYIRNTKTILNNFGKFVRHLKISEETNGQNLLRDVLLTNCGSMLKGLSLNHLQLYEIDMDKYAGVFDNLEFLELIRCVGDEKSIEQLLLGHQYPQLRSLIVKHSSVLPEILQKFFMRPRNIKKLNYTRTIGDILSLIVLNASELDELLIFPGYGVNLMSLVQLRSFMRLGIHCPLCDQKSVIALIKELSVNNRLEMLAMSHFEFTDEFCNALSKLTNLKELRLWHGKRTLNYSKSLEMLGQILSKLESLMLLNCPGFPYGKFLASACKSENFRQFYVRISFERQINSFIEKTVKGFIEGRGHRCVVSGDPLCIHLYEGTFNRVKGLLTRDILQSIEKYGNIKILPANDDAFEFGF